MLHFGTYIKHLREQDGYSVKQFADKIETDTENVLAFENDLKLPPKKQLKLLTKNFNADKNQLLAYYYAEKWFNQIKDKDLARLIIAEFNKRFDELLQPQSTELISKITAYLPKMPIEKAWVFGSLARGEMNSNSDIDILIRFQQPKTIDLFDYTSYIIDLEKLTKRKIDLVEEGFEASFAKESIHKDKILIYERTN
jgi:predicted nucleotidyltransferase